MSAFSLSAAGNFQARSQRCSVPTHAHETRGEFASRPWRPGSDSDVSGKPEIFIDRTIFTHLLL